MELYDCTKGCSRNPGPAIKVRAANVNIDHDDGGQYVNLFLSARLGNCKYYNEGERTKL